MIKTIKTFGIESVEYAFTEAEVMGALLAKYGIRMGDAHEFNMHEPLDGLPGQAVLTVRYTRREKP